MTQPWVAIQRNPTSGSGKGRAELIALCAELRRLGIRPRLFSRRERLAARLETPEGRDGLVCLVAAGGDGTVGDIVNRYPGIPLAILPLGTENLLARHLGIPRDGRRVAQIIAAGVTRQVDLGQLNGRRFTLMVSAGFDAAVVHGTHARRRGTITRWNYIQPILDTLRTYRYSPLRIDLGDDVTPGERPWIGRLAIVVNAPVYALGLPVAASAHSGDGQLDLRLFERPSAFQMARYLYKVACGRHEGLPDVRSRPIRRLRIESDEPVPLQCDGDPAGWTPAEISVLPGALTVLVPDDHNPTAGGATPPSATVHNRT